MQYRKDRKGNDISLLGYGFMRFTKKNGKILLEKAEAELLNAIENGVNYIDTAYVYMGSETALGKILAKNNCRDKVYIATKLPHYLIKSKDGMERLFMEQLKRLQTDHVDYYLMHMLTDIATWERLLTLGIGEWIADKLKSGAIRNIGFSYHGHTDMFLQLVDAYDWDFCQIQYNYMDEHSQAGRRGLAYAAAKGLPVIIMEPLRGGRLVNMLPDKAHKLIAKKEPKRSAAEWGLRWLFNQPEVTCVLSGMNSLEMVKENVRIASSSQIGEFNTEDFAFIEEVKTAINEKIKVGCTACGYCMPCPAGVNIPGAFRCYNAMYTENKAKARAEYLQCTALRKNTSSASQCIQCGKCEQHCPQHIAIREDLKHASRDLERVTYKIAKKVIGWFRIW